MSHDTLLHRAIRPLVRRVAHTGVRPNHLTALRITLALGAVALFATGSEDALLAGGILFACSAVLDRADGELARQTRRFTPLGHWLDLGADCGADALALLALGIGARSGPLGGWAVVLGCAAAISIGWLFWQLNRGLDPAKPSSTRLVDPDDAIFLLPVCVVVFGPAPTLAVAGVVTPVAAIYAAVAGLKL